MKLVSKKKALERDLILNEDCVKFMQSFKGKVEVIMTSPPYNTGRPSTSDRSREHYEGRYDIHLDTLAPDEYIAWTKDLFKLFDKVLIEKGVVIYNMSYSSDATVNHLNCDLVWRVIGHLVEETNFTVADRIVWKKKNALPNNASTNKLTRIVEDVFVFCRKDEYKSFNCNKELSCVNNKGQKYYKNYFNFIEAKNNDGKCSLNKATYSTDLCLQLLGLYGKRGDLVYDPFMGTGTTAVASKILGMHYLGTELSAEQCKYAEERINSL